MAILKITSPEGKEHTVELGTARAVIGRGPTCEVRLPVRSVSLRHAELLLDGPEPILVDLGSTNGTTLNQKTLSPNSRAVLRDGDLLEIGTYKLLFSQTSHDEVQDIASLAHLLARDVLQQQGSSPSLTVLNGPQAGLRVALQEQVELIIGRAEESDLQLSDAGASRRHARVRSFLGGAEITDLGSRHGTIVDQVALAPNASVRLKDRSEIVIGQTRIVYSDPEEALFSSLAGPESVPTMEISFGAASPLIETGKILASTPTPSPTPPTPNETKEEPPAQPTNQKEPPLEALKKPDWTRTEQFLLGAALLCWLVGVFVLWEAF